MQTLIDIPEAQLEALHALSKARNQTPSMLLGQALDLLLANEPLPIVKQVQKFPGFGLWKDRDIDGVEFQQNIRAEWDREWDR